MKEIASSESPTEWPDSVMDFKGDPDFPRFEDYREELLPADESSLR